MTLKKLLFLTITVIILEIIILVVFGGFGPDAEKKGVVLKEIGFVRFLKYEMGLADFQDVKRWNLDGTSQGEPTFWAVNKVTTIMMLIVDCILILAAFMATRVMRDVPGRLQNAFEIVIELFRSLVVQTLGENGKRHIPMIGSLFLYLWIANIIGIIPMAEEPTRDLNVTVGHMIAVIFVVHFEAIRIKGLSAYLKGYLDPFFIMAPLNIIGELAKGVSLAFRLFGNILGGAIIVMVISYLFKYTLIQVGLNLFFSLFVGTIQAFVFTMLGMTYIAVATAK
ncbi:F0F1 ATP synthase subunit A [Candidatus Latescibacterota bacterium]